MPHCSTELARRFIVTIALAVAFASSAAAGLDPERAVRESQAAVGRQLPDYAFTDSDGKRVRLADYRGKPLLVHFVYTGCTQVCPTAIRFLERAVAEARTALGTDAFSVVTIGFNVPFDSPQAMRAFARQQGIAVPGWSFLSPDVQSVADLTRAFGFVYMADRGGFEHITQVTIVDASGRVYRQIYGEAVEPPVLVGALRALLEGAPTPAQSLRDIVERVRILCTVYDPLTGKYRLNYGLFIEIFAGLSVLGAVSYYLVSEWRRQRRCPPATRRA